MKALQMRVNKATKDLESQGAEAKAGEAGQARASELAQKQGRVGEMMRKLAVKLGKENDAEEKR